MKDTVARISRRQMVVIAVLAFTIFCSMLADFYLIGRLRKAELAALKIAKDYEQLKLDENRDDAVLAFMRDNMMKDPRKTINPRHPLITAKAKELGYDFKRIYSFVKRDIFYDQKNVSHETDIDALKAKRANCFGVSALLVSLLRASGVKPYEIKVVIGEVEGGKLHAWVEMIRQGQWYYIDASDFIGRPDQEWILPSWQFYRGWMVNDRIQFNDQSFRINEYLPSEGFAPERPTD